MKNLASAGRRISIAHRGRLLTAGLCLLAVLCADFSWSSSRLQIGFNRAFAQCASCQDCITPNHEFTRQVITDEHLKTRDYITEQFVVHREGFIVEYWWEEYVLAAMMMMTEQLVSAAMEQMLIVGTFFDAEQQLENQRAFQKLAAQAHKDYQPSFAMCEIGTLSRSIANSQRQGEFNTFALSQQIQDRQMRLEPMASGAGKDIDSVLRWAHFRNNFCDPYDDAAELGKNGPDDPVICKEAKKETLNRDIDYTRTVDYPLTIRANFTNESLEEDEVAVYGLASNLYGNDVFAHFPQVFFENPNYQDDLMYVRAIVAKRSVAQNSFSAIIGMKSEGPEKTDALRKDYMANVLKQLGIEKDEDIEKMLHDRPSYYAQMELLTKKLYQRPEFFTGLYDKPANVERTRAALRAIGLMQNMDLYKSKLRSEAALAVLTEMEVFKNQDQVQNRMNPLRGTER